MPKNVGARLHCASCHLDAGRNPSAAWWVGMADAYDYPATDRLQRRIDQCFSRSMNGRPLGPDKAADMQALITYMRWIDGQWHARPENKEATPARGFPPVAPGIGLARRGHAIFQQKCNFCHGHDGQGRYVGGVYFRPAVWGTHSFAATAGLGQREKTLASFIKANMPLGSGGLLTDQEAWDLAAFIEAQNRPKGK
jgi:cytochrome c